MTAPMLPFVAALLSGTRRRADAIVALSGDGEVRLQTAAALLRIGIAPLIVVSGGLANPPHSLSASESAAVLMGQGVDPARITEEATSTNTREQAVAVAQIARAAEWRAIVLVSSTYHLPRAFLTFVGAFTEAGLRDTCRLVPCPAPAPWGGVPAGDTRTRLALLDVDLAKCAVYGADVATPDDGLAYLLAWESRA